MPRGVRGHAPIAIDQGDRHVKGSVVALLWASLLGTPLALAQAPEDNTDTRVAKAEAFIASLKPQSGRIALPGGKAELALDDRFRYLDPADTKRLLEEAWSNPPGSGGGTLGMLLPADVSPLSEHGWGVIITYSGDGHVSDDDADKIDYADVLKQMQDDAKSANQEREKSGFQPVSVVGWAEPPHYDKLEHKIYWAKDLAFGNGGESHTLNYFIRVLGREGVLELNAVAGMDQLQQVRSDMKQVVNFAQFTKGNQYADFNSGTDKVAAYGLAALVAGGVAAKTGLLAKLLALLIAAKKFVILAFAGLAGVVSRLFKKKS